MAQMVLPQTPAPGIQKESGSSRSTSSGDTTDRKRDYESVSQAEQKRLDRQKAERNDKENSTDEPQSAQSDVGQRETPGDKDIVRKGDEKAAGSSEAAGSKPTEAKVADEGTDLDATALPLTFAELQAWLSPKSASSGEVGRFAAAPQTPSDVSAGVPGQLTPGNGLFSGLLSNAPGQQAKTPAGVTSDVTVTEAMKAAALTDLGRNADSGTVLSSGRFQSALDLVSQQGASGTNAAKLAAETAGSLAGPLKGYATSIDVPVGHAEWGDKLVGKLSWLTARNMSVAEIHLTPPDMGPMEVKVRVQNEQANIIVHSANPVVRDQLELHSHRLRDMLGEQGLSLAGFDVSDSPQQQTGDQGADESHGSGTTTASPLADSGQDDDSLNSGNLDLSWKGEVDIFA
ncbi:flagellar hook-length control protein FliK [Marinobacter sp.]|uniref:flagellar hook-length control protein FliK n=1 Tax=Marinobacter sp. TaxID=50741 RepID=UPI003A948AFB